MKNSIYALIAIVTLGSCQKDVDIDLNSANPNIVIEANYTSEDSTVAVRITKTVNYFGSNVAPTVDDASVTITDHNGISQTVPFSSNGDYILVNYIPEFNTFYTLSVVSEGELYTAQCKLSSSVQVDVPTYEWNPGLFGSDPGFRVFMNFLDPADTVNFYNALLTINGEEFDRLNEGWIQDDLLTDGNYLSRPLWGGPEIDSLDTVSIELRAIDDFMYDYINAAGGIVGGSTSAAPGNPTSNWDNGALGYFSAYSATRAEVILP